jgi:hypothetical protein
VSFFGGQVETKCEGDTKAYLIPSNHYVK